MNNIKVILVAIVVCLGLGYSLGRYVQPAQEVEKIVEVEKEVIKKDIVTVVKVIKNKDGTEEVITTTTDKSQENRIANRTSEVSKNIKLDWHVTASAKDLFKEKHIYELQVERRVLGPLFIAASYNTNNSIGVGVGIEF